MTSNELIEGVVYTIYCRVPAIAFYFLFITKTKKKKASHYHQGNCVQN